MRDIETIDSELRLVARAWRVARHMGCTPSTAHLDELLDERSELTGSPQPDAIRITLQPLVIGRLPR